MRRAWLALGIVAVASVASARVVMAPTIPRMCPSGKTWEQVDKCVARFGKVTLERELPGAKLIRLAGDSGFRVPGLYIYAQKGSGWHLAGMYDTAGDDVEIFGFQRITLAKHTGFRVDLGFVTASSAGDGDAETPAVLQEKVASFCSGVSYGCFSVITSCDVLVDGRSRASFRGTLKLEGDVVHVVGDRSRSWGACETPESEALGWDGTPAID